MPSPFGDDAAFPGRPDTADFWRLSDVVLQLDGALQENRNEAEFKRVIDQHIDFESLIYMAQQHATKLCLEELGTNDSRIISAVTAGFLTGVITGISFQKKGGHR